MEEALSQIVDALRRGEAIDAHRLDMILRAQNRSSHDATRHVAKKRLLPFYLQERACESEFFKNLEIDEGLHDALVALLRAKPRRTASGVATITVLTKPWPCGGECLYCPNDVRMPKSYLSDEPACQRAERCFFDPYLQVSARLRVLEDMGHNTDKVELIVLGGTFSDYPEAYRIWFVKELFRALNEFGTSACEDEVAARSIFYEQCGIQNDPDVLASQAAMAQRLVDTGESTYNEIAATSNAQSAWKVAELKHLASPRELEAQQRMNEDAKHRNVGLVVETRPELMDSGHAEHLRWLGCTKVQLGIQSLDERILKLNARASSPEGIERAFAVLREFGFKSHIHFMVNLLGSTPESDKEGYRKLVSDPRFMPDEVKLYPCALVESSRLMREYLEGRWHPYNEAELLDVLSSCIRETPQFTRISRMIRDISSKDIVVGNKKTNLRQMVELEVEGEDVQEMRMREIGTSDAALEGLALGVVEYRTSNTSERFIQYVTANNSLVAFLRLSLPDSQNESAMIREVHVYGKVSRIHEQKEGTQHSGLGRALIEKASSIATEAGYSEMKVISAVGTRGYYRALGFEDAGLYQARALP